MPKTTILLVHFSSKRPVSKMHLTDIQLEVMPVSSGKLRAYCKIVFDNQFLVRDIRLLEGPNGIFVAMPSRKKAVPCGKCQEKNALTANYCSGCGTKLEPAWSQFGHRDHHADVAHPITTECREEIESALKLRFEQVISKAS